MTNPESGQPEKGSGRATEMSVERVEKTDGRYLIYYEWRAPALRESQPGPEPEREPSDV